jgi:hypothetical protein
MSSFLLVKDDNTISPFLLVKEEEMVT